MLFTEDRLECFGGVHKQIRVADRLPALLVAPLLTEVVVQLR